MFLRPSSTSPCRPVEADRQVGAAADDAHLVGRVEALGVAAHALALGVPVEQAGAEDDVRQLREREPGLLRERVRRELAADPGNLAGHRAPVEDLRGLVGAGEPLGREVGRGARVLGRVERDPGVHAVAREAVDLGQLVEQLLGRLGDPARCRAATSS